MAARLAAQLKWLNECIDKPRTVDKDDNSTKPSDAEEYQRVLREFAATAGGELSSSCNRLVKIFENKEKTKKRIDELLQLKNSRKDKNANVDDKETVQSAQNISAPHQVTVEEGASKGEENNVKSFRDNYQGPVEEGANKDEGNKAESLLDVLVSSQGPEETGGSKDDESNVNSFQDIPVPPQEPVQTVVGKEEENAEFFQGIPVPPDGSVEAGESKGEDNNAEPSMKFFSDSFHNLKANDGQYKSTKYSHEYPPLFQVPEDTSERFEPFRVLMDVSNFSPEEIEVEILKTYLVVHGKHEMVPESHGEASREFTRKFEIPDDVDIETFRALVDCYGVLTVEASRKPANSEEKTLDILSYNDITEGQQFLSLKHMGDKEFEETLKRYVKDGNELMKFAKNLVKQKPSHYIPMEKLI